MTALTAVRRWRLRHLGSPASATFTADIDADPAFRVEAAPGEEYITVGAHDLTVEQAARLSFYLADAVAVARSLTEDTATVALRNRGTEVQS